MNLHSLIFYRILIITITVLLISCDSERTKTVDHVPPGDTLLGNHYNIQQELWNPRAVHVIQGKYLIVLDDNNEDIFKVFSLPEIKYLYSWGRVGQGPKSFTSIPSYHSFNSYRDRIVVAQSPSPELSYVQHYIVTDTSLVPSTVQDISFTGQRNPFNNLTRIDSTLYFANYGYGNASNHEFIALQPGQEEPVFKFSQYPPSDLEGRDRYRDFMRRTTYSAHHDRFYSFYAKHNSFKIFNSKGNLLKHVYVNDDYIDKNKNNRQSKLTYRTIARTCRDYIFTLGWYNNIEYIRSNLESVKPYIEIWKYDGKPISRYPLSISTTYFDVSCETNYLYTYNYGHLEEIVKYDISSIIE